MVLVEIEYWWGSAWLDGRAVLGALHYWSTVGTIPVFVEHMLSWMLEHLLGTGGNGRIRAPVQCGWQSTCLVGALACSACTGSHLSPTAFLQLHFAIKMKIIVFKVFRSSYL